MTTTNRHTVNGPVQLGDVINLDGGNDTFAYQSGLAGDVQGGSGTDTLTISAGMGSFGFDLNAFPEPFNAPVRSNLVRRAHVGCQGQQHQTRRLFAIDGRQTLQMKYLRRRAEDVGFPDFEAPMFFQRVLLPYNNLDRCSARYEARQLASWLSSVKVPTYFQDQERLLRTEFPVQFPVPSPRFFPINVYRLDLVTDTGQHVRTIGTMRPGLFR